MHDISPGRLAEIDDVLARFGLSRTGPPTFLVDSVLNDNYRVETEAGTRFLKFIQPKRTREVVEAEHRATAFAGDAGIPVARPFPDRSGRTAVEMGGRMVALFPFVEGRTARRGSITSAEAKLLGDLQGRLQTVLSGYSDAVLEARDAGEARWDTERSILEFRRLDELIESLPVPADEDREAQRAICKHLAWLESGHARPSEDFASLPVQLDHGDYHERNVLLSDGKVAAVIDWERIRVLPRAFQLIRAVDYMGLLAEGPLEEYLAAYGRHVRLQTAECAGAVDQWWQSQLHGTWLYTEIYVRGNQHARRFLAEQGPRLERLADPRFRRWLSGVIARHCATNGPQG